MVTVGAPQHDVKERQVLSKATGQKDFVTIHMASLRSIEILGFVQIRFKSVYDPRVRLRYYTELRQIFPTIHEEDIETYFPPAVELDFPTMFPPPTRDDRGYFPVIFRNNELPVVQRVDKNLRLNSLKTRQGSDNKEPELTTTIEIVIDVAGTLEKNPSKICNSPPLSEHDPSMTFILSMQI
jgi:hypothetical protein